MSSRVRARLRNGFDLFTYTDDIVGRTVYLFGDLDPKITGLCKSFLEPGDTFLDIGANYGLVSLYAARALCGAGRIVAFEPQHALADMIRDSAAANNLRNIEVQNIALSFCDGRLKLSVPGDRGKATLCDMPRSEGAVESEDVDVRNASDVLHELGIHDVRLIKMDVEGHEAEVLEGMRDFVGRSPPQIIIFEANDQSIPWWQQRVFQLLSEWKYRLFELPHSKFRLSLRSLDIARPRPSSGHDFVAVHPRARPHPLIRSSLSAVA